MTERERIVIPWSQPQPESMDALAHQLLGARTESDEHGLIECGLIMCDEDGITETHWFKVLS